MKYREKPTLTEIWLLPGVRGRRRVKYRKKSVVTEATQWFQNGDHPHDESELVGSELSEGKVVTYFRVLDAVKAQDVFGSRNVENQFCPECGNFMKRHGILNGEETVCPGDYIVTARDGHYYRLNKGEFESQYELYAPPPRPSQQEIPLSDLEAERLRRRELLERGRLERSRDR